MIPQNPRIGFIGFGEAGYNIARGLKGAGIKQISAYDKAAVPPNREFFSKRAQSVGTDMVPSLRELIEKSDLMMSAVVGKVALEVAREAAPLLDHGKMYVDLNNSSAISKEKAAVLVNAREAHFVDVAMLGGPALLAHKIPIYAAGDGADEFKAVMSRYGMDIKVIPGKAGTAIMIQNLWHILMKGIQALYWETILAAHKAGIDMGNYPRPAIKAGNEIISFTLPDYLICHAGIHAARKAGELEEIAEVLRSLGIEPIVTEAASRRLAKCAQFKLKEHFNGQIPPGGYRSMLEAIDQLGQDVT